MNWKKVLLIALVATGLIFLPAQHSNAQISVGIGYPGYGYGYYPRYRYYRHYDYGYYPRHHYYRYYHDRHNYYYRRYWY